MLRVLTRSLPRDPLTCAACERGAAIKTHGQFDSHPGAAVLHAFHEARVELCRFALHEARLDGDTCAAQSLSALPLDTWVGIFDGEDHTRDTCADEGVYAGWCASVMAARLECDVHSCTGRPRARSAHRHNFRVRFARALVPALADELLALRDHAADARIWMRRLETTRGERQSASHCKAIEIAKHS